MNLNHYTPISLWVSERHVVHKETKLDGGIQKAVPSLVLLLVLPLQRFVFTACKTRER